MVQTISAPLPDTTEPERSINVLSSNISDSIISTWPAPLEAAPVVATSSTSSATTVTTTTAAGEPSSGGGGFYSPEAAAVAAQVDVSANPAIPPWGSAGSELPAAFVTVALSINISANGIYASSCSSPAVTLPVASSAGIPSINGFSFPPTDTNSSIAAASVAMVTNSAGTNHQLTNNNNQQLTIPESGIRNPEFFQKFSLYHFF